MGSLVAELAEKLSSATNNFDIDEGTMYVNTSADTVGIGTTNPASKLDVQGTMQVGVNDTGHDVKFFGATAGAYLEWDESADELEIRGGVATPGKLLLSTAETTVVDGNKLGQIDFQAPVDSAGTDAILVGASIYAEADATFSASVNATELVFATGASEAAAEKMRITSDGKGGIGTTAPVTTWAAGVSALALKGASGDNYSVLELYNHGTDANDDNLGIIDFGDGSNKNGSIRVARESATNDAYMTFWTNNQGSITERIRITAVGNVGIGTTAPYSLLHVHGKAMGTFSMGECIYAKTITHQSNNNLNASLGINWSELSQAGTVFHMRIYGAMNTLTDAINFFECIIGYRNDFGGTLKQVITQKYASHGSTAGAAVTYDVTAVGSGNGSNAIYVTSSLQSGGSSSYDMCHYITIHRVDARSSGAMFRQS